MPEDQSRAGTDLGGGSIAPDETEPTAETAEPMAQAAPSRSDEWIELIGDGAALALRPDLFDAAFKAVADITRMDARAWEMIGRILDRRLADVPLGQGLAVMTEALQDYMGADGAYLVHWLAYADTPLRLGEVATVAPEPVTMFLRSLLAEYGGAIDVAQRIAVGSTEDWTSIEKRAYVDMLTGRQVFVINVNKADGSLLRLECTPDSLLGLTTHLLELVNAPQSMAGYSETRVNLLARSMSTTIDLINAAQQVPEADAVS